MTETLETLAHRALDAARAAGADAAEATAFDAESLSVEVRDGDLESAERAEGREVALRVLIGGRQAAAVVSDTRPATLATLAERVVAMARAAPEDPYAGLAPPDALASARDAAALDLLDPAEPAAPAALEAAAREAEAAARATPGVTRTDTASAGWSRRAAHRAMTNGFSAGSARSRTIAVPSPAMATEAIQLC
ncbi:MAG: DNA gyrase modulator, partial [Pseudomonadota bacterium]